MQYNTHILYLNIHINIQKQTIIIQTNTSQMLNQNSYMSSIDTSSLSLFLQAPKSQLQLKYEQVFRQTSQYRLQIRELKQDNEWLRTSYEGLQNQSNVLKDLLRQKKQMIVQINTQLRIANDEINRLEDTLVQKQMEYNQVQQVNQDIDKELKTKNQLISKLEYELQSKNREVEQVVKEKQKIKYQYEYKQRTYITQMHERATKILQKCSPQKSPNKNKNSHENILNELVNKIQSLIESQNQQKSQYTQQVQQKNKQISSQLQRISNLEYQLQQATDLMQQYQRQSKESSDKAKQMQIKLENGMKIVSKNFQQTEAMYSISINKLIDVLNGLFKDQTTVLSRVGQLMKLNKNQYEIDIALQQLRLTIQSSLNIKYEQQGNKKSMMQLQNRYQVLQQQYETLKLKHMALQRQFQAIIDDNRRILKFNQLSRYRTQRNLRQNNSTNTNTSTYNYNNTNKENVYVLSNRHLVQKYQNKKIN